MSKQTVSLLYMSFWHESIAPDMLREMLQLILQSLQKSVEKKPLDVEEVAAAAEAKVAKPNIAKVRPQPDNVRTFKEACQFLLAKIYLQQYATCELLERQKDLASST